MYPRALRLALLDFSAGDAALDRGARTDARDAMPVSVVVGGQFGSEGKGKVALDLARRRRAAAVVRVGGTNSGHTGAGDNGHLYALRQLPAAGLADGTLIVLPPGAIIDIEIFSREIELLGLERDRVRVDSMATVISADDKIEEKKAGLIEAIGSTGSGTGAALQRRISRQPDKIGILAGDHPVLQPYIDNTTDVMRGLLEAGRRIVIEGTQGFGLSLLHGGFYPKATSRDTTAAAFVAEAGLSPLDVDQIVMVIRTFPIRVAGDSGPLINETTWKQVAQDAGLDPDHYELTTATRKVRRVGQFDSELVRRAISVNNPTDIVLNHLDYIDAKVRAGRITEKTIAFIKSVERGIGRKIGWFGATPDKLWSRENIVNRLAA